VLGMLSAPPAGCLKPALDWLHPPLRRPRWEGNVVPPAFPGVTFLPHATMRLDFARRAAASSKSRAARQAPRSPRKVRSPKGSVPA